MVAARRRPPMSEVIPPAAFEMEITATEADMDELGHVNNVVYLSWVQDASKARLNGRNAWGRSTG